MRLGTHVVGAAVVGVVSAVFAGGAHAQLFVESVAEPGEALEITNDLGLLTGGEISAVGGITDFELQGLGYIVVHTPGGVPFLSWILTDPDVSSSELIGHRVDPADKNLMVLESGTGSGPFALSETVMFKIDPFAGTLGYQWRYMFTGFGENLGIEVDGETSLVAAAVVNQEQGTWDATLLRFDNAAGTPVFFNRYPVFGAPVFNGRFFDVAVDEESGDIFAVGSIGIDDPDRFIATEGVLIARFDSMGAPVWFNVYEAVLPQQGYETHVGVSIELVQQGLVAVTARSTSAGASDALHLSVTRATGAPIGANLIRPGSDGSQIFAAFSSLELLGLSEGSLLASGFVLENQTTRPSMWAVDPVSGAVQWFYSPESRATEGTSAIEQPGEGLLLGGQWRAPSGTIDGADDMLLARTTARGVGYCDQIPPLLELSPDITVLGLQVDPAQMPSPDEAGLLVQEGNPIVVVECECAADLDGSGSLDFGDVSVFLTLFTNGDLSVDFDNSGVLDFGDVSAFLALFAAGCP